VYDTAELIKQFYRAIRQSFSWKSTNRLPYGLRQSRWWGLCYHFCLCICLFVCQQDI